MKKIKLCKNRKGWYLKTPFCLITGGSYGYFETKAEALDFYNRFFNSRILEEKHSNKKGR